MDENQDFFSVNQFFKDIKLLFINCFTKSKLFILFTKLLCLTYINIVSEYNLFVILNKKNT